MPVPIQKFWLTCLSEKKIGVWLEGESTGRIFPGRRETFFPGGGVSKFLAGFPAPPLS